jgi:N-acetylneuraminic acid mutarotase
MKAADEGHAKKRRKALLPPAWRAAAMACVLLAGCTSEEATAPSSQDPTPAPDFAVDGQLVGSVTVSWSVRKALPVGLRAAAAAAKDGRLYLLGGNLGSSSPANTTRVYNPSTNAWTTGASFSQARDFAMAAALVDGVHLVGGAGSGGVLSDHRLYRPATNTWVARTPLPKAVRAAVARVVTGKLYIIGGKTGVGPTGAVQIFNPSTNAWTPGRAMPTPRFSAASAVINGLIYVAGGQTPGIGTSRVLERYDPKANTWTPLTAMPAPREALGGANVGGRFCVAGGRLAASPSTGKALAQTYCYDPTTNAWMRGPDMITPRAEMASTEFQGALYTVGGRTPGTLATRPVERLAAVTATGSIRVVTVTTGTPQDPDGYILTLDGGIGRPVGSNAEVTFGGLAAGLHSLVLSGVAPTCTVAEGPFKSIPLTAGDQANVSYVVTCLPGQTLELVSARDHVPGSFLNDRAVYADRNRIYLGSAQGKLFVLARDRASNFPIVQTIDLGVPITGVRGDDDRLYVTSPAGMRIFTKGSSLSPADSLAPSTYLGTVALFEGKIYVTVGQATLAVDTDRLYLSQLNEGEVAWEIDKTTLQVTRTYGAAFIVDRTVVYDRLTGAEEARIPNPVPMLGSRGQPNLYAKGQSIIQTQPGCCGRGITIVKGPDFVESEFIPEPFANAVATVENGLLAGTETGAVEHFDLQNQLDQKLDLRALTGHFGGEDIEIRSLWADGLDDLVFAGSSWGNDASRGPSLPSFFVLRLR